MNQWIMFYNINGWNKCDNPTILTVKEVGRRLDMNHVNPPPPPHLSELILFEPL